MIALPPMPPAQAEAWLALLQVSKTVPSGWCLVGGQMVALHCWERDVAPHRPTNDADLVLDIRAHPTMLLTFTSALRLLGFQSAGESWEGHQHRWVHGAATVDVLIPRHVGERAAARLGVSGGTTLETPGGQAALDRGQSVALRLGSTKGKVWRPTLEGAIAAKAAAYSVWADRNRVRHLTDLVTLSTLITPKDRVGDTLTTTERGRIAAALKAIENARFDTDLGLNSPESRAGLATLLASLNRQNSKASAVDVEEPASSSGPGQTS